MTLRNGSKNVNHAIFRNNKIIIDGEKTLHTDFFTYKEIFSNIYKFHTGKLAIRRTRHFLPLAYEHLSKKTIALLLYQNMRGTLNKTHLV